MTMIRDRVLNDIDMTALDPGIRLPVFILRQAGFETTDSGDGVSKPAEERVIDQPHVAITVESHEIVDEANRLLRLVVSKAKEIGSGWHIEASYSPQDGAAILLMVQRVS